MNYLFSSELKEPNLLHLIIYFQVSENEMIIYFLKLNGKCK
jgi:hypothetical protein